MISRNGKTITVDKDNLIVIIAASIRAGSFYTQLMEEMITFDNAKILAKDFIEDALKTNDEGGLK